MMRVEVDGHAASAGELRFPALTNYGHFSSMQVRRRAVRGLDLHLRRLDAATRELYGTGLDEGRVRGCVWHALGEDVSDATVRVIVFRAGPGGDPSVLVAVSAPATVPDTAQRLQPVVHQRPLAHIKHTGTFGQIHHGLLAERNGFDDALFTTDDATVLETTIANVGCCQDRAIIWPSGPALHGITMQLLERALPETGLASRRAAIKLRDLASFRAVFLTNSLGISPVGQVGKHALPKDAEIMKTLAESYHNIPWDPI